MSKWFDNLQHTILIAEVLVEDDSLTQSYYVHEILQMYKVICLVNRNKKNGSTALSMYVFYCHIFKKKPSGAKNVNICH